MKKQYIYPETIIVKANLDAMCGTMSTDTDDNTGGGEKGPGTGDDNEDPGAKRDNFNVWEDEV